MPNHKNSNIKAHVLLKLQAPTETADFLAKNIWLPYH